MNACHMYGSWSGSGSRSRSRSRSRSWSWSKMDLTVVDRFQWSLFNEEEEEGT